VPNIGPLEIAVVLVIVLIIFGPKRLPELGSSMGRGIREFKASISGDKNEDSPEEKKRELEASKQAGEETAVKTSTPAESVEGEIVTEKKA
jgi:sec-independent protein translocase protein TatA